MKYSINKILAFSSISFISISFFAGSVNAQMNGNPWGFKTQNRASIAALMKQVENENTGSTVVSTTPASITTLVCGGDSGGSSATGNASCIILNNSDGSIKIGQDASGDQDANNDVSETTNVDETINVDDILSTLSGEETSASTATQTDGLDSLF